MTTTDFIKQDNARTIVGTLRPSGRFSVCQTFPRRRSHVHSKEVQAEKNSEMCDLQYLDFVYRSIIDGSWYGMQPVSTLNQSQRRALGLSIAANSNSSRKRGSNGISSRQRDVVCWAANALERVYQRKNMSFLTLTLPAMSDADLEQVQDRWSEIVNTVLIYLQREFKKHGLVTHIVGCTEIQMERKERTGRAYPHLHLVFRGKFHSRSSWVVSHGRVREIWRRSVCRFLPNDVYQWRASENIKQVYKSTGGYLAKYLSKSSSKPESNGQDTWHPSDWIICSRKLRKLYEQLTRKGYEVGQVLLEVVRNWEPAGGFKRPIEISSTAYGVRKIGDWGWLKGEFIAPDWGVMHSI